MTQTELYDQVAIEFPWAWPQDPRWVWVNVHDGKAPKLNAISDLLERYIGSSEVVVVVHSEPGIAAVLPKRSAVSYIAGHVLEHEIQASDPLFTCFVTVSRSGVGTGWEQDPRKSALSPSPSDA